MYSVWVIAGEMARYTVSITYITNILMGINIIDYWLAILFVSLVLIVYKTI
jgi:hypothetical protein